MRKGAAIAATLGGRRNGKGWSFCCPCHDDRNPSASIRDDALVTCFAGCDRKEVLAALGKLGFTDDGSRAKPRVYRKEIEDLAAQADFLWDIIYDVMRNKDPLGYFFERGF